MLPFILLKLVCEVIMFKEILFNRRSIRKFTDEALPAEFKKAIAHAAYFSPSSRTIRPYRVVFVEDKKVLEELGTAKTGSELLAGCALAAVIIGEPEASDVWIEDCSIVATNILNMCEFKKIGACWVQIRNRKANGDDASDFVRSLLNIPESFE